jgi:hypothetical protein
MKVERKSQRSMTERQISWRDEKSYLVNGSAIAVWNHPLVDKSAFVGNLCRYAAHRSFVKQKYVLIYTVTHNVVSEVSINLSIEQFFNTRAMVNSYLA